MAKVNTWINDTKMQRLEEILKDNINGYPEEFIHDEKRERLKSVFLSTSMSSLVSELTNIGLLVLESSLKSSERHKIDMSEYWEYLLYNVLYIKTALDNDGEPDVEGITKRLNTMFRGDVNQG